MYFMATLLATMVLFMALSYHAFRQENVQLSVVNGLLALLAAIGWILEWLNRSSREEVLVLGILLTVGLLFNAYSLLSDRVSAYSRFYRSAVKALPPDFDQDRYEVIFSTAHREFLRAIDVFPESNEKKRLWHHWLQGMENLRHGHLDEALQHFTQIHDWIVLPEVLLNIGAILLEKNMLREALSYFDDIEKHFEPDALLFHNKGLALFKLGKMDEAEKYYKQAATEPRCSWKIPFTHAKLLRKLGRYEEAVQLFTQAAQMAPSNFKIWAYIGILYGKLGQPERALSALENALRLKNDDAVLWYNRGNMLVRMKDYTHAIRSYDRALEINPGFIRAWNNKGIALTRLGKMEEAVQCYRHALSFDSRYHEALLNCALALDQMKRTDEAMDYYRRFLQCAPPDLQTHRSHVHNRLQTLTAEGQTPMMKVA